MPIVAFDAKLLKGGWRSYATRFQTAANLYKRDPKWTTLCLNYAEPLFRRGLPVIYDTEHLASLCGFSRHYLLRVVRKQDGHYRTWMMPKRTPGEFREIAEPLPALKSVQRWLHINLFGKLRLSKYAKGFVPRLSVLDHARWHTKKPVVCTIDVKDFFPSIGTQRVAGLVRSLGYTNGISWVIARICTLNDQLPQGAPTSPSIANVVASRLDARLFGLAKHCHLNYSRYADDLAFSGREIDRRFISATERIVSEEGFSINTKKTRVMHHWQQQRVTGVVVNSGKRLARSDRRRIRQQIYYIRSYGIRNHLVHVGDGRSGTIAHLLGRVQWALFIDPADDEMREYESYLRNLLAFDT